LPFIQNQFIFIAFSLIAALLPDIDSKHSKFGKKISFRPIQIFLKHRGILHSFLFLFFITLLLFFFFPVLALPFLLGYGLHLVSDSLTISGVRLFYPWGKRYSGFIRTEGRVETFIFVAFLMADFYLFTSIIF
jgi:inner membrane protein